MSKIALIIVNCQKDFFPGGRCELVEQLAAASNIQRLLKNARQRGHSIIHVQHIFKDPNSPCLVEGTIGAELHPIAAPEPGEHIVVKYQANSLLNTKLQEILEHDGVQELVICGGMTHVCIDASARATADLGYPITVIYDACATRNLEFNGEVIPARYVQGAIMASLAFIYGKVISTDEYLLS